MFTRAITVTISKPTTTLTPTCPDHRWDDPEITVGIVCCWRLESEGVSPTDQQRVSYLFPALTFSARIFAQRAFAARTMLARPAAERVLLPLVTFGLAACFGDTAVLLLPFRAVIAAWTAVNCRCNFASSPCNASTMFMTPPSLLDTVSYRTTSCSPTCATVRLMMLRMLICTLFMWGTFASSTSRGDDRRVVKLSLEGTSAVHVGDYAIATIPSDHIYDKARHGKPPFARGAILPARLSEGYYDKFAYRAVHSGNSNHRLRS